MNAPKRTLAPAAAAAAELQRDQDELRRLNGELARRAADLQRLNQTLIESEQRLRLALEVGRIGLWVWNSTDTNNSGDWSERLKEIFGMPLDAEVTHDMFLKCVHPEDRSRVNESVMQALAGANGGEYREEYRAVHPQDGSEHWVTARGQAFFDSQGRAIRFIGTVMDITDRKLAEESAIRLNVELEQRIAERTADLARSNAALQKDVEERKRVEERLQRSERNLAEGQRLTKTGSWVLDFKTGNTDWSVETCRIFGFPDPPPSPHYEEFRARVHLDDRDDVDRGLRESFETGEPRPLKYRFILPDGVIKHIETISQPVWDDAGAVRRLMGTVMDVTERVKTREELEQSKDQLRLAIDTIPGLVWVASPDGSVEYHNQRWIDFVGLGPEEASGWGWRAVIHPEDLPQLEAYWKSMLVSGKAGGAEARLRRFDGVYRWFLFRGVPLRDGSGKIIKWYGQNTDIDERKRAEDLVAGEKRLLEMIAQGDLLPTILDAVCRLVEELTGDVLASILLASSDGKRLRHGAAPSLPKRYIEAIDGGSIGPSAGSCGTAAYRRAPVIVSDIANDPLWDDYRQLALAHGLQACWSTPIFSTTREVLGTFALYRRTAGSPTTEQNAIVEQFAHLVSIAIERTVAQEALLISERFARGQAEALTRAVDALARESSPDRIVEHVLRTLTLQLDAHSSSVWLREEPGGLMAFESALKEGAFRTKANERSAPLTNENFWPEVFRTGKPYLIEDIRQGPEAPWREYVPGVVSILAVPMLIAGQVEGVIEICFSHRRAFRAEEMELAQALAHQAMLAIQLMRLSVQNRESGILAERNRMARDIHDTLAQGFTGVVVQMEAAEEALSQNLLGKVGDHIGRAGELARESLREARRSVQALRPQVLEEKKLCDALSSLMQKMTAGTGMQTVFAVDGAPRALPPEWEENLLRIGQEVLTNALRHAQASEFRSTLIFDPHEIRFVLKDNGRGFDPAGRHDGFGLQGMRERVESMGGHFTVESAPNSGTSVLITLPLVVATKSDS
jgi:PAS domain S-box-containing protein